jgi:hypothetical protein
MSGAIKIVITEAAIKEDSRELSLSFAFKKLKDSLR